MIKKVLISGPLLSCSGYGEHIRQIFKACEKIPNWVISCDITPWGATPWNLSATDENGLYSRILSKGVTLKNDTPKFDISIQVKLPNEWNETYGNFNIGVTAAVETDICSKEWATVHREKMNAIIVPSEFTKKTLTSSGTGKEKTPIFVIPEAFYDELLLEPTSDPLENIKTDKNFLTIGTITSGDAAQERKNILNLVNWFCDTFENNKNVGLVLKVSLGRETTIDKNNVRYLIDNIKGNRKANIYLVHGSMSRNEMTNLYKSKKIIAYVSPTRGEGFGIPLLEAAVAGLPVIATDWSAHTEYLHGDSFTKIAYDITPIPPSKIDNNIFVKNALWAEPRQNNFKRALRRAVDDNSQKYSAKQLSNILIDQFNIQKITSLYHNLFTDLNLC